MSCFIDCLIIEGRSEIFSCFFYWVGRKIRCNAAKFTISVKFQLLSLRNFVSILSISYSLQLADKERLVDKQATLFTWMKRLTVIKAQLQKGKQYFLFRYKGFP